MKTLQICIRSLLLGVSLAAAVPDSPFLQKPYLQLGQERSDPGSLALMWHAAPETGKKWQVEVTGSDGRYHQIADPPVAREVRVQGIPPHVVYTAKLAGLAPSFRYRVTLDGKAVFDAKASGRPLISPKAAYDFVVFGDSGADTVEQKEIAALTHKLSPGMIFHTGDIVYSRGLISEYRTRHFPIYNADKRSEDVGAPLTRSVVMTASAGNHDLATRDLGKYPDALPYFYYWSMPLNGPDLPMFANLTGDPARIADFRKAAGTSFPRMVNYSFVWGNSYWLVLDSNSYADWSNPAFQKWVTDDLNSPEARKATWRFVGLHHPGFNSSKAHFKDQQARLLAPIFEKHRVDVVFSGHVHNYQRSRPLTFVPGQFDRAKGLVVDGKWALDRDYDGKKKTKANGVIYLVTGAGGNKLYDPEQEDDEKTWQEFTVKFIAKMHSLTRVQVSGNKAVFTQIDRAGFTVDRFVLTR